VNEHDAIARIKRLSHSINCADEIAEVIERLIKERDEARQMICRLHFTSAELQHDFAKAKGWNCFKEDGK
jgi:chorismate mutase